MFFITDCNGKTVGNKLGYRTHNGAFRQATVKGTPAYNAIWSAYYALTVSSGTIENFTLWSIGNIKEAV